MSYILDALRKSDQQRRRGAPPTLLAPQPPASAPGRRLSLAHALLAAALLAAGVGIGVLRPWQTEQPAPTAAVAVAKAPEPAAKAPPPVPVRPPPERKVVRDAPAQKAATLAQSGAVPAAAVKEDDARVLAKAGVSVSAVSAPREAVTAVRKEEGAKPLAKKPDGAPAGDVAQARQAVSIAELPLAIQQELPKMAITVHAYSGKPQERLVGINDRMLREGEYVAPGLLLEQVTLDGMILSYKGYRFRRGVR